MPYEYDDPIISNVRRGDSTSPYLEIKEALIVDRSAKCQLTEYPNKYHRVKVKDHNGNDLYETSNALPEPNEFYVDYEHKIVTFHKNNIGRQFEFHYFGEGNSAIPATSIYTERDGLTIKETLQQLTDTTAQVRDETRQTNIEVQENENVRINNENKREENENKREENENTRQQNEEQRQRNELTRQSQEVSRQENTAKAISDAEKATENANTQANYAKEQGDFAKSQGDYAKEQGDYAKREADRLVNTDVSKLDLRLREIEQYGGKFSWKYNPDTESLDLVVIG